jgi:hypothetical protein
MFGHSSHARIHTHTEDGDEEVWVEDGEDMIGSEWSEARSAALEFVDEVEAAACAEIVKRDVEDARMKFAGRCGVRLPPSRALARSRVVL